MRRSGQREPDPQPVESLDRGINFVNDDILGSLEFATRLAGAKSIVVMGHIE